MRRFNRRSIEVPMQRHVSRRGRGSNTSALTFEQQQKYTNEFSDIFSENINLKMEVDKLNKIVNEQALIIERQNQLKPQQETDQHTVNEDVEKTDAESQTMEETAGHTEVVEEKTDGQTEVEKLKKLVKQQAWQIERQNQSETQTLVDLKIEVEKLNKTVRDQALIITRQQQSEAHQKTDQQTQVKNVNDQQRINDTAEADEFVVIEEFVEVNNLNLTEETLPNDPLNLEPTDSTVILPNVIDSISATLESTTNRRTYLCSHCGHNFKDRKNNLMKHIAKKHSDVVEVPEQPEYPCPICSEKYSYQGLKEHLSYFIKEPDRKNRNINHKNTSTKDHQIQLESVKANYGPKKPKLN